MRKVYKKPYLEVVEYVGNYGYASDTTSTCKYLTCLIGNQSSENIEGLKIYTYESGGVTYYIWYYEYGYANTGSNDSGTSYQEILNKFLEDGNYENTDGPNWHIAVDSDNEYNAS